MQENLAPVGDTTSPKAKAREKETAEHDGESGVKSNETNNTVNPAKDSQAKDPNEKPLTHEQALGCVYITNEAAEEFKNENVEIALLKADSHWVEMNVLRYLVHGHPLHATKGKNQDWRLVCRRSSTFEAAFGAKHASTTSRPGHDGAASQPSPPDPVAPVVTFWLHAGDMPQDVKYAMLDYTTTHPDESMLYPYLAVILHDDSTNLHTSEAARHKDLQAGVVRALRDRTALLNRASRNEGNIKLKKAAIHFFAVLLTTSEFEVWNFRLADDETTSLPVPVSKPDLFDAQRGSADDSNESFHRPFLIAPNDNESVGASAGPATNRQNPGKTSASSHARSISTSQLRGRSLSRKTSYIGNDARHSDKDVRNGNAKTHGLAAVGPKPRYVAARLARGNHVKDKGANLPTLVAWLNAIHFWAATVHGPAVKRDCEACVLSQDK